MIIFLYLEPANLNSNSIHGDSIPSIVTQSLPINDTSSILIQSTLFSSAPI
ncbi:unnamed protein product, partial [Rotaria magnacalcarata]